MFEWLFKFDRSGFEAGDIGLQSSSALYTVGAVVAGLLLVFAAVYVTTRIYTSARAKAISLGLRTSALALLCLPLLEPVLVTTDVVPNEAFVAVVTDVSASMTLPDGSQSMTRGEEAGRLVTGEEGNSGLLADLDGTYKVRRYTFAESIRREGRSDGAALTGDATNLTTALERVRDDFEGLPLAGIVLLTDGGNNEAGQPERVADELQSLGVPLHIVGLGRETFEQEREIVDAEVSSDIEISTRAEVNVKVRSWAPGPAEVSVYRGEEQVATQTLSLQGEGRIDRATFFFDPEEAEAREYTVAVAEAPDELNTTNNVRRALIDTRRDTVRVLYFEGQLRPDFKFIKRVLENDPRITVSSVLYTGTNKLYRQGVEAPNALRGGFANSDEELNAFDVIIFGDIAASTFSVDQLEAVERFARQRGGGFLMLGGRQSFTEGSYLNTPVANVLPVSMDPGRQTVLPPVFASADSTTQGFAFVPTPAGFDSPILRLSADADSNRAAWGSIPSLSSINYLGAAKPGATVLAEKPEDEFGGREPLLVVQRYGKGRSAALPTASTWQWQMRLPADDTRYERFWRQFVRWLAASAPGHVAFDVPRQPVDPGAAVPVSAQVFDASYEPLRNAEVTGRLTGPAGTTQTVDLDERLGDAGTYAATITPREEGLYRLEVTAYDGRTRIGQHERAFLVHPSQKEFRHATLKRAFLEQLAATSGGTYYAPGGADAIPGNLRREETSASVYHTAYLWDMPLLFGLIILLLSIEWVYRRRQGLP